MKVQNFKRALLICSVMSATSGLSWAAVSTLDITGAHAAALLTSRAVLYNSSGTQNTWAGALTTAATTTSSITIDTENPSFFDAANSTLGINTSNLSLNIIKDGKVTIDGAMPIYAPIKSSGGGTLAFTTAAPTAGTNTVATVPTGYTSWTTYLAANPLYYASGASTPTAATAVLDVAKSLTLDLSGVTAGGYIFPLDFALQAGQTLTILGSTSAANVADIYNFSGALRGSGNIIVKGYGVFKFTGTAADYSGSISILSTNATDYPAATPAMTLYKPALNFTSNAYTAALSIPANTYQIVDISGAPSVGGYNISGAISGAGSLLVKSGTGATQQRTLHLSADNSSWTGGLVLGDGTTTAGPKIQVDNATGLGSATATTAAITVKAALTAVSPVLAFSVNATTARTIDLSTAAGIASNGALHIDTYNTYTSNLNGIVSGAPTAAGDGLRLIGAGTTNLNAANTHTGFNSSAYATYVTGGGIVGMGTATSLGYNATANLTGVLLDDGVQLTVPSASTTIANPLVLYQGTVVVTAPTAGATTTFTGVKSGSGGLQRGAGLGAWTELAAHTYTGGFNVPTGLTGITLAAPVVVNVGITSVVGTSSAFGNGPVTVAGLGTKFAFSGAHSLNNKLITANGPLAFDDGGYSVVVPADIAGTTAPSKAGTLGTVTFTPVAGNSYTGTFVNGGGTVAAGNALTIVGSTNNVTLKGNTVLSGLKAAYLPYGATTPTKNVGTTDLTVQVQGS